jgi:hypothetical protein
MPERTNGRTPIGHSRSSLAERWSCGTKQKPTAALRGLVERRRLLM